MLTREDEKAMLDKAVASFPSVFGLVAFPGEVFRISKTSSYFGGKDNKTLMLYTEKLVVPSTVGELRWVDFAKATVSELRAQVVNVKLTSMLMALPAFQEVIGQSDTAESVSLGKPPTPIATVECDDEVPDTLRDIQDITFRDFRSLPVA